MYVTIDSCKAELHAPPGISAGWLALFEQVSASIVGARQKASWLATGAVAALGCAGWLLMPHGSDGEGRESMISITVDLREASKAEADAYMDSQTRQFLLTQTAQDLAGAQLTIKCLQGEHFVQVAQSSDQAGCSGASA